MENRNIVHCRFTGKHIYILYIQLMNVQHCNCFVHLPIIRITDNISWQNDCKMFISMCTCLEYDANAKRMGEITGIQFVPYFRSHTNVFLCYVQFYNHFLFSIIITAKNESKSIEFFDNVFFFCVFVFIFLHHLILIAIVALASYSSFTRNKKPPLS